MSLNHCSTSFGRSTYIHLTQIHQCNIHSRRPTDDVIKHGPIIAVHAIVDLHRFHLTWPHHCMYSNESEKAN